MRKTIEYRVTKEVGLYYVEKSTNKFRTLESVAVAYTRKQAESLITMKEIHNFY